MIKKTRATILFYPTGIVHFRNLELLVKHFRDYRFLIIVESWLRDIAPEKLEQFRIKDQILVERNCLPGSVWKESPDLIFFSMAYPNPFRLRLVWEAEERGIPVLAIEEVNQLALNDGVINHYFLPLDYLGTPSETERERFLALGLNKIHIEVTGWPFFEPEAALRHHHDVFWKEDYQVGRDKYCLLILGSLKERDIISLETRKVRNEILRIVTAGLPENYQLIIKPHPIETKEGIDEIKNQAPQAIIVDATIPIEPLLLKCHIVINRGNSQVSLLAMLQDKPIIVVPVGIKTIFHGILDEIIVESPQKLYDVVSRFERGYSPNYREMLHLHFPYSHEKAFLKVRDLFQLALEKPKASDSRKKIFISVLFAFLGDISKAEAILSTLPEARTRQLLRDLYHRAISPAQFRELLNIDFSVIERWHLQALLIRRLQKSRNRRFIRDSLSLLEDFDGDVNPHYFIDDLLSRIEIEFKGGRPAAAQYLIEKFKDDYSIYEYYKQGFEMMETVYSPGNAFALRKAWWLVKNCGKKYTRRYFKEKFIKD